MGIGGSMSMSFSGRSVMHTTSAQEHRSTEFELVLYEKWEQNVSAYLPAIGAWEELKSKEKRIKNFKNKCMLFGLFLK
jgi:hypothetical protein